MKRLSNTLQSLRRFFNQPTSRMTSPRRQTPSATASIVAVILLCSLLTIMGKLAPGHAQTFKLDDWLPNETGCEGGKGHDPKLATPTGPHWEGMSLSSLTKPTVVSRNAWGCPTGQNSPGWTPQYTAVTHLIVHHSAGANISSDWAGVVRAIWQDHTYDNGWGDIGYNYLIDPNGIIYEGRAGGDNVIGAHFCSKNGGTFGVCLLGNFQTVTPTQAALSSLKNLLAWKAEQRGIHPLGTSLHANSGLTLYNISGHQNGCSTVCPGNNLYALLPSIRTDVNNLINGGTVNPPAAPMATAATSPTGSGFTANWNSSSGATGYRIDVSTSSTFSTLVVNNYELGNSTAANVTGLSANTTYYYRVRAYNGSGTSGNSGTINVTTTGNATLIASVSPSTVQTRDWNQDVVFTITVENGGGSRVSGASIRGNDGMLGADFFIANATDANGQYAYRSTVPNGKANGTYSFTFYATKAGFNDSLIVNRQAQVNHVINAPDLSVGEPVLVSPTTVAPGGMVRVDWTERNNGTGASSPAHSTKISLASTAYGTTYQLIKYAGMPTINGQSSRGQYDNIQVPNSIPAGDYYVTVFIDSDQQVAESNESNNIGSSTPTRLTVSINSYTIAASAGPGGSIAPSGNIIKAAGSSQVFTASPNANYVVNQWLVDGAVVQTGGTEFTLPNIQADRSVQVTFLTRQYAITRKCIAKRRRHRQRRWNICVRQDADSNGDSQQRILIRQLDGEQHRSQFFR